MEEKNLINFGHILDAIRVERRLSQFQLATLTGYSESMISRVANGQRALSQKLAQKLAEVVGGSSNLWLEVFEQTANGSTLELQHFRNLLIVNYGERSVGSEHSGAVHMGGWDGDLMTTVRRLNASDIESTFSTEKGEATFRNVTQDCEISNFDPTCISATSYDLHVGGYFRSNTLVDRQIFEIENEIVIPASGTLLVITREHITLPSWIEAEIGTASNIALKGLIVSHGPIIDPGWGGYLHVSVHNPTQLEIAIQSDEPFLTLRFWMHADG